MSYSHAAARFPAAGLLLPLGLPCCQSLLGFAQPGQPGAGSGQFFGQQGASGTGIFVLIGSPRLLQTPADFALQSLALPFPGQAQAPSQNIRG